MSKDNQLKSKQNIPYDNINRCNLNAKELKGGKLIGTYS